MRCLLFFAACSVYGQLIPPGQPIPQTAAPPVVFLNGFEADCSSASFAGTFGMADQILQNAGRVSVFFNYCTSGAANSSIEDLGDAFATFLASLKYSDGRTVDPVDCVAFSMGGLILRSYLSGKRNTPGAFQPPATTHVRKTVFLATPNFGTGVTQGLPFSSTILGELTSGSEFLFDLATWNQGSDDLHGVDAVTAIGNGGTGKATATGFGDGIIALTSASLGFYAPGRTRVVPYCHTTGLINSLGFCPSNALGIAQIDSPMHDSARIIISFLNGNSDWQTVGEAAEQDPLLSTNGGLDVQMRDSSNSVIAIDAVIASHDSATKQLNTSSAAYTDMFPAGPAGLIGIAGTTRADEQIELPGTVYRAVVLKPGPVITGLAPAASKVFPLGIAPGEIVSIYGSGLATATAAIGGTAMRILQGTDGLLTAIVPDSAASGFVTLTVQSMAGKNSVNVFVAAAVPAIFTTDQSGSGEAAAVDASTGVAVDANHPLRVGDYLSLYGTGLGATTMTNGLAVANRKPTVTIGGLDCAVTYAGRAPGIAGVDQINCIAPKLPPQSAAQTIVTSGNRYSNVTTVAIQ